MTDKQQKAFVNLTILFEQFGVIYIESQNGAAYFQAAKNAPLEKRSVELMARKLREMTGLRFMLKAVEVN